MPLISEGHQGSEELEGALPGRLRDRQESHLAIGSVFAERFEIQALLGSGALGFTYRAVDCVSRQPVTLKTLQLDFFNPEVLSQRFDRFVSLNERLHHPNLVRIQNHGLCESLHFLVRDFIDGQSLDQLILARRTESRRRVDRQAGRGPFRLEEVLNLFFEVSQVLKFLEKETFHGGLTPANILITDERVMLTDLALARIFQPAQYSSLQIYYGNGYYYLAPEYDRAGAKIDQRSDLYAAAVMAYEMLTGEIPRSPVTPPSALNPDIPAGLDGPFLKALDLNPENRQDRLADFLEQLHSLSGLLEGATGKLKIEKAEIPLPPPESREDPVLRKPEPKRELANSRIAMAIAEQLRSSAEVESNAAAKSEKMPVLPVAPSRPAPPLPPVFAIPEDMEPELPGFWTRFGIWILPAIGLVFAVLMWGSFLLRKPLPDEVPEELAEVSESAEAPVANPDVETKTSPNEASQQASETRPAASKSAAPPSAPRPPAANAPAKASAAGLPVVAITGKSASRCPADMVYIASGSFVFGNPSPDRDYLELGPTRGALAAYCVDLHEFPNRPGGRPRIQVSYPDAVAACSQVGKRLCSEREWERACKGSRGTLFPYGTAFQPEACNTKDSHGASRRLANAGAFSRCRSDFGVYDLSGNVAEWTSGTLEKGKGDRMIRGGSMRTSSWGVSCTFRQNRLPSTRRDDLGFRCCKEAQ